MIRAGALVVALLAIGCERRAVQVGSWHVRITDGEGGPAIAARVLLFARDGTPVRIGSIDLYEKRQTRAYCQLADGALGTWDGIIVGYGHAEIPIGGDECAPSTGLRPGSYTVWAWRGLEHERWEGTVELPAAGRVETLIPLERITTPSPSWVADLHVHAQASRDSLVPNSTRVLAQVASGVNVIGLSDHNAVGDLDAEIAQLGLGDVVSSIASVEISAGVAHLGVYPAASTLRLPEETAIDRLSVQGLFDLADQFPGEPIVQLNHPRFRVTALFDATGWKSETWPPPFPLRFDALEVLSGHTTFNAPGDRRVDESLADFYALIDHGVLVTALGNSDTHHLNGVRDALTRNYVTPKRPPTIPVDESAFVTAVKARNVWVSSGPVLEVRAGVSSQAVSAGPGDAVAADAGQVWLSVRADQARYMACDRVRVLVGGEVVQVLPWPAGQRTFSWEGPVAIGSADTWIGVDVTGETPLPVEMTGTYQAEKGRPGTIPAALINPILVDSDRNGRWTRGQSDLLLPVR